MTIESDTEWLRSRLTTSTFHTDHPRKWVAVRDAAVVFSTPDRGELQTWLDLEDASKQCVLAFVDDRPLA